MTVTIHDKPAEAKLPAMASKMRLEETTTLQPLNVSIPTSERQKRLLPYMNFYLGYNFNQPNGGKSIHYQPPPKQQQQIRYEEPQFQKQKYTPFSESNALPGPFFPMSRGKINYIPLRQPIEEPDYSAIYDKLALLKQQQQQQQQQKIQQNSYNNGQFLVETFDHQKPSYQPQKVVLPTTKTVQTYTPTNIDVPPQQQHIKFIPNNIPYKVYIQDGYRQQNRPNLHHIHHIRLLQRPKIYIQQQPQPPSQQYITPPTKVNVYQDGQHLLTGPSYNLEQDHKIMVTEPEGQSEPTMEGQDVETQKAPEPIVVQGHRIVLEPPRGSEHIPQKQYEQKPLYLQPLQLTKLQAIPYDPASRYQSQKHKIFYLQKPQEVGHPQYIQVILILICLISILYLYLAFKM